MSVFQDELVERLSPIVDQGDWEILLRGIGAMFSEVELLARDDADGNPGWSIILDVDRVPTNGLPYLAQIIGLRLRKGFVDAAAREAIRSRGPWKRGKPEAIRQAAMDFLTDTKAVVLRERDGSAYRFSVLTYVRESPEDLIPGNGPDVEIAPLVYSNIQYSQSMLAALLEQKPAGLRMRFDVLPAWDITTMEETYPSPQTIADLEAAFTTTEDLETQGA